MITKVFLLLSFYFVIKENNMGLCFKLFLVFAKIGAVTFGGGYAMLPLLQRDLVEKYKWVTEMELTDYFAIGQCTPGVIAVNTATFVGHKLKGTAGAIFATIGVVFPSMVIITIIAAFISNFAELQVVKAAFAGIRVCVCVLILTSVIKLFKGAVKDVPALAIYLCVLALAVFTSVSVAFLVVAAGVIGIVVNCLRKGENKK